MTAETISAAIDFRSESALLLAENYQEMMLVNDFTDLETRMTGHLFSFSNGRESWLHMNHHDRIALIEDRLETLNLLETRNCRDRRSAILYQAENTILTGEYHHLKNQLLSLYGSLLFTLSEGDRT